MVNPVCMFIVRSSCQKVLIWVLLTSSEHYQRFVVVGVALARPESECRLCSVFSEFAFVLSLFVVGDFVCSYVVL